MNRSFLMFGLLLFTVASVAHAAPPKKDKDAHPKSSSGYRGVTIQEPAVYRPGSYEESVFLGQAALVQAKAQAKFLAAQSALLDQQARAEKEIADKLHVQTFLEKRRLYAEAQAAGRQPRLTSEEYAALAKPATLPRLNVTDYNRATGRLAWPAVLSGEEFAAERRALDAIFAARGPNDAGPQSTFHRDVRSLTDAALGKLKSQIDTLPPQDSVVAKRFLTGLATEAQAPTSAPALASAQ